MGHGQQDSESVQQGHPPPFLQTLHLEAASGVLRCKAKDEAGCEGHGSGDPRDFWGGEEQAKLLSGVVQLTGC